PSIAARRRPRITLPAPFPTETPYLQISVSYSAQFQLQFNHDAPRVASDTLVLTDLRRPTLRNQDVPAAGMDQIQPASGIDGSCMRKEMPLPQAVRRLANLLHLVHMSEEHSRPTAGSVQRGLGLEPGRMPLP